MTRFARAKGSKASNERLPNEPTPWHIMKQQLEDNISSKNHQPEKAKTAKQLLNEKDDPFYYDTTGNVNNDWAEFDRPNREKSKKEKEEIKSNGKSSKKKFESSVISNKNGEKQDLPVNDSPNTPKIKAKKLKSDTSLTESAENSMTVVNAAKSTSVTPYKKSKKRKSNTFAESTGDAVETEIIENVESTSVTPNKKSNKRKSNTSFAESAGDAIKTEMIQNSESTPIAQNKKSKKQKSETSLAESADNSMKVEETNNTQADDKISPKKKSKKRKSDATTAESAEPVVKNSVKVEANEVGSEPKKKKKRDKKSSPVESVAVGELPKEKEEKEDGKVEGSKEPTGKMSKRQKRNQKRKNKIASNDSAAKENSSGEKAETPASGGFDAAGNEWSSNVNFGKKFEKKFNGPANGDQPRGAQDFKRPINRPNGPENNAVKRKAPKTRDDKEHKRRKPDVGSIKCTINGMDVEIVKYDGFPVKKEDAERLKELRQQMVLKGIPKSEIDAAMKLERRKAEKALARVRKQVCFHCRKAGHNLSDCPELGEGESATGICFKCGSTEHTHFECKVTKKQEYGFASCFICREQGHIAKQCPDNPKGLYPQGGSCKICGDVTHLRKDCPDLSKEKEENAMTLNTITENTLESLDEDLTKKVTNDDGKKAKGKIVKF